MTVLAAQAWPTNAHMIADVAKLGYPPGRRQVHAARNYSTLLVFAK